MIDVDEIMLIVIFTFLVLSTFYHLFNLEREKERKLKSCHPIINTTAFGKKFNIHGWMISTSHESDSPLRVSGKAER